MSGMDDLHALRAGAGDIAGLEWGPGGGTADALGDAEALFVLFPDPATFADLAREGEGVGGERERGRDARPLAADPRRSKRRGRAGVGKGL